MIICIYCGKGESETMFNKTEHVMPRLMGKFEGNLTLIKQVCDRCNGGVFNPLETKFKEDTEEGIFYQMFNLENSFQIRIKGDKVKTSFSAGLGDQFFDEIFPFFQYQENNWKIVFLPQIKIKRYGNEGYIILLVDLLKKHNPGSSKFREIKKFLVGTQSKDVAIFGVANDETDSSELDEAKKILANLEIPYNEGERKYVSNPKDEKRKFDITMNVSIGHEVGRIIAKIAFNYFAYCATNANRNPNSILFHPNLSRIKNYILGEFDLPIKEIIPDISNEPLLLEEKLNNTRYVGHMVTFFEDNGYLIAKVSFLGKRVYTVVLGELPAELKQHNFGSGHLFDPVNKKVLALTQNISKAGSNLDIGFGLFNRV